MIAEHKILPEQRRAAKRVRGLELQMLNNRVYEVHIPPSQWLSRTLFKNATQCERLLASMVKNMGAVMSSMPVWFSLGPNCLTWFMISCLLSQVVAVAPDMPERRVQALSEWPVLRAKWIGILQQVFQRIRSQEEEEEHRAVSRMIYLTDNIV